MFEFERTRLEVAGADVTVTSWYDPGEDIWRATAPALTHLPPKAAGDSTGASRAEAIAALRAGLTGRRGDSAAAATLQERYETARKWAARTREGKDEK